MRDRNSDPRSPLDPTSTATSIAELTKEVRSFPTLPDVALRVLRAFEADEPDLSAIASLIATDPVLTARVVRMARSPLFGRSASDLELRDSIMRIGIESTRDAVTAVSIMRCLPRMTQPISIQSFWTVALGSALASRHLARELGFGRPEDAYLGGLVHTLGDAYLAIHFPDRFGRALADAEARSISRDTAVADEFGVEPPLVTERVLCTWDFPEAITHEETWFPCRRS